MNPQESIGTVNAIAAALKAFAHDYPILTAVFVAILLSWGMTRLFRKPIRALMPDSLDAWGVYAFCCFVAGIASFWLWPANVAEFTIAWRVIASLLVGVGSPAVYEAITSVLCWKWPSVREHLSLKELYKPDDDEPAKP